MKIREALQNLQSLNASQIQRLEEAQFVKGNKITDMGQRVLDKRTTQDDLNLIKKLFEQWYCYVPEKIALKSPIDCGHR